MHFSLNCMYKIIGNTIVTSLASYRCPLWLGDKETREDFVQDKDQLVCEVWRSVYLSLKLKISQPAASWPRAQAEAPPSSSVFHLYWVTQGQMGHLHHLDPTLLGYSTVAPWSAMKRDPLIVLLLTDVEQRKEELIATSHAHPPGRSSKDNQHFYGTVVTFCYDLGRSWVTRRQFLQLLDSSGLSQDDEELPSKSARPLP